METKPLAGLAEIRTEGRLPSEVAAWWLASLGAEVSAVVEDPSTGGPFETALRRELRVETDQRSRAGERVTVRPTWAGADGPEMGISLTSSRPLTNLAADQAVWASTGMADLTRATDATTGASMACVPSGRQPSILSGTIGALLACAGLVAAATGATAFANAEADVDELLVMMQMQPLAVAQLPSTESGGTFPGGVFEAIGGPLYARPVDPAHWGYLLEKAGWKGASEVVWDADSLSERADAINAALRAWFAGEDRGTVVADVQADHVPLCAVNTLAEALEDPSLGVGELVGRRDGSTVVSLPWQVETEATRPGGGAAERTGAPSGQGLLGRIRVLDLSWAWAGPYATTLLGDLGAEILNVEWTPRASNLRMQPPFGLGPDLVNAGGWWSANQRGKKSIGINLKDPAGVALVLALAEQSDVVVQNFAPGVVERLGVGYDELAKHNPRLVYVSMSAFGPKAGSRVGYGTHVLNAAGGSYALAGPHGEPAQMGIPYPDPVSGTVAALAAVAYLVQALRTGEGAHIQISELVATCAILTDLLVATVEGHDVGPDYRLAPDVAVRTTRHLLHDERLLGRSFWRGDATPALARTGAQIAGVPFRFDGSRPQPRGGSPGLFADTETVLRSHLGLGSDEIRQLRARDAIRGRA